MISRCPSCGAQVDDEAPRCPSCHWDFSERRRIAPAGGSASPTPAKETEKKTPPPEIKPGSRNPAGIEFVPFSEATGVTDKLPRGVPKAEAPASEPPKGMLQFPKVDPAKLAKIERDAPFAVPEEGRRSVEPPPERKEPKPESAPRPRFQPPEAAQGKLPEAKRAEPIESKKTERSAFKPVLGPEKKAAPPAAEPPRAAAEPPRVVVEPPPAADPPKRALEDPPATMVRRVEPRDEKPVAGDPKPKASKEPAKAPPKEPAKAPKGGAPADSKGRRKDYPWAATVTVVIVLGVTAAFLSNMKSDDSRSLRAVPRAVIDPTRPQMPAAFVQPPSPEPPAASPLPVPAPGLTGAGVAMPAPAPAPAAAGHAPAAAPAAPSSEVPVGKQSSVVLLHAAPPPVEPEASAQPSAPRRSSVVLLKPVEAMPLNPAPVPQELIAPKGQVFWTFEGRVYDLVTLRPVANAELQFLRSTDQSQVGVTATDDDGRYRMTVAAVDGDGGYIVKLQQPDYAGYLDETNPPYSALSRTDRLTAAAVHGANRPWRAVKNKAKRDVVAVPRRLPGSDE